MNRGPLIFVGRQPRCDVGKNAGIYVHVQIHGIAQFLLSGFMQLPLEVTTDPVGHKSVGNFHLQTMAVSVVIKPSRPIEPHIVAVRPHGLGQTVSNARSYRRRSSDATQFHHPWMVWVVTGGRPNSVETPIERVASCHNALKSILSFTSAHARQRTHELASTALYDSAGMTQIQNILSTLPRRPTQTATLRYYRWLR